MTSGEPTMATHAATDGPSAPPFRDQAAELKNKAARGARTLADSVQHSARARLDRGKETAATTLSTVAHTLRDSGTQLRDGEEELAGEYMERVARGIDRAAEYVQSADIRRMTSDVEDFARKRPALFVGTAFAAGFVLGRLLKSSGQQPSRASAGERAEGMDDQEFAASGADDGVPVNGSTSWQSEP